MTAFIVNQFYMLHNSSKQTMNDKQITTETEQLNRAYLHTAIEILILLCPDSQRIIGYIRTFVTQKISQFYDEAYINLHRCVDHKFGEFWISFRC